MDHFREGSYSYVMFKFRIGKAVNRFCLKAPDRLPDNSFIIFTTQINEIIPAISQTVQLYLPHQIV